MYAEIGDFKVNICAANEPGNLTYKFSAVHDDLEYSGEHEFKHLDGTLDSMRELIGIRAPVAAYYDGKILINFVKLLGMPATRVALAPRTDCDLQVLQRQVNRIDRQIRRLELFMLRCDGSKLESNYPDRGDRLLSHLKANWKLFVSGSWQTSQFQVVVSDSTNWVCLLSRFFGDTHKYASQDHYRWVQWKEIVKLLVSHKLRFDMRLSDMTAGEFIFYHYGKVGVPKDKLDFADMDAEIDKFHPAISKYIIYR